MAMKTGQQRRNAARTPAKARPAMSREARAAYGELQQGLKSLEKSITEIQHALGQAERKIEAEARARIRELRKEAQAQLGVLKSKQRDASRVLRRVSSAAEESWQDIKQSADAMLADARATAVAVVDRFRAAFGR